jgi:hypothetical protein
MMARSDGDIVSLPVLRKDRRGGKRLPSDRGESMGERLPSESMGERNSITSAPWAPDIDGSRRRGLLPCKLRVTDHRLAMITDHRLVTQSK